MYMLLFNEFTITFIKMFCITSYHLSDLSNAQKMCRNGTEPCDLTSDGSDINCVNAVIEEMDAGQRNCTCNLECEELIYELSVTQSDWPSEQYEVKTIMFDIKTICRVIFPGNCY